MAPSQIHINRNAKDDKFYRYMMDPLQTKIEGKGNGIKTVMVNLPTVAQSLARDTSVVIKYFGFELGAQTKFDSAGRYVVNGAHEATKLQDHLDGFINKFVLCKECQNPETDFVIKNENILMDCKACGKRTTVDPRLKLSSFILKNQPKKGKKDKAARKAARKAKNQQTANGNPDDGSNGRGSADDGSENGFGNGDDGGDAGSDVEFEKVQEAVREVTAVLPEPEEEQWATDFTKKALKARKAQLPGDFAGKESDEDETVEKTTGEKPKEPKDSEVGKCEEFGELLWKLALEKGGIKEVKEDDVSEIAETLEIKDNTQLLVMALAQTIFQEGIDWKSPSESNQEELEQRARLIKKFMPVMPEEEEDSSDDASEKEEQKDAMQRNIDRHEKSILGGTERFFAQHGEQTPGLYESLSPMLEIYWDEDLIGKTVAKNWLTKVSDRYTDKPTCKKVRRQGKEFLMKLKKGDLKEKAE